MVLFDSHCHLTDERFAPDVDAVLDRARAAGVAGVVSIASDADDATAAAALAARHADVWCTAGIHPHAAATGDASVRARVEALAGAARVVALGETGLDYHYDNAPRDMQRRLFGWHLELAARTGLGVVVHSRDAEEDTAAAVRSAAADVTGVLHCFTAGRALLECALEAGWYVSFAGLITFRNWTGTDLLQQVPADRLLIETDSPYLAPVPERGRRNEPAFVRHTCAAAAGVLGVDPAELALRTTRNARRFYGIDDGP
jgi:TatD DNase family protein